ncbi:hypothetical protein WDJ51_05410 [Rathayibacter sp. YIM 133350]|uniref:hypothetical protein n=1 Tax=Rathayibacter sp. YIM 133350 TaxID=3131992 RepID=UPI00307FA607
MSGRDRSRIAETAARPARAVFETYSSEHSVYGVVLVSALIAVGWHFDTDLEVLWFILGTVGVFWLTHIYAAVVASRHTEEGRARPVREAVLDAARHSSGIVVAMLLPAFFLGLASVGVLDEYVAYYIALWLGVLMLAIIGYGNSARNRSPLYLRILSAIITAGLGLAVIWLGTLVH